MVSLFRKALPTAVLICLIGFSCTKAPATIQELMDKIEAKSQAFDAKVKDVTIEVEATTEEETLGTSKIWRKGDRFRMEGTFRVPGMGKELTSISLYDGKDFWTVLPGVGKMKIPEMGISSSQYADWSKAVPEDAQLLGEEKIEGRNAFKIAFADSLMEYSLWLDTERLVPLKVSMEPIEGGFPATTILYKDYRKVEDLWGIPYGWEIYMGDQRFTANKVKSVVVNSDLPDALFDASKIEEEEIAPDELMKRLGQG